LINLVYPTANFELGVKGVLNPTTHGLGVKGVLNPNFRPFSFELKKNRFFEINFDLGFRVL